MTEIRVDYDPADTAVYIKKPDGNYVAVYVGDDYTDGFTVARDLSPNFGQSGELVWQPPVDPKVDTLAKALWEVVPYDRVMDWKQANDHVKEHYRNRARRLLEQFEVEPK